MSTVWYKRFPSDFLNGVARLTAEERGVYASLIDMMYDEGGSIPYMADARPDQPGSPSRLASTCGCSTRRFNIILKRLINDEKVIHRYDRLFNKRVFKQLNPDFISTLSLHYLVLIFPEWRKIKGLADAKNLEPRIHKKINKKNDQEGGFTEAPDEATPERHLFDHVCAAYGQEVWLAWFSPTQVEIFGGQVRPRTKFIQSKISQNYSEAVSAAGFTLGELMEKSA